jgi:hypothetical protein
MQKMRKLATVIAAFLLSSASLHAQDDTNMFNHMACVYQVETVVGEWQFLRDVGYVVNSFPVNDVERFKPVQASKAWPYFQIAGVFGSIFSHVFDRLVFVHLLDDKR